MPYSGNPITYGRDIQQRYETEKNNMVFFKLKTKLIEKIKKEKDEEVDDKNTVQETPLPKPSLTLSPPQQKETQSSAHKKEEVSNFSKTVTVSPMVKIMEETLAPPKTGTLIEGPVLVILRSSVYVDLAPFGTGIIYGREFLNARDIIKKMHLGDTITAKIVDQENEDGYIELSLKEARQAIVWGEAEEAINKKTVFELPVKDANKGGLLLEWQGIIGFLPASQLKVEHYPRVEGGDKEKVLEALQKFVGTKFPVCILSAAPKEGKLIFSEKEPEKKEKTEIAEKYSVGDVVEGEISGIVDFGLFVKIDNKIEGLVHISEMDWGLVDNPRTIFKEGEHVNAQIIEIKDGKISLSIKALKENPWVAATKKYKKGDKVSGVVIKYNRHGALISIEEGVAGLVHISEFGNEEKLKEVLELGKSYQVMITFFEPQEQRMTLSYTQKEIEEGEKEKKSDETKEKTTEQAA